jgi:hypothetical protein
VGTGRARGRLPGRAGGLGARSPPVRPADDAAELRPLEARVRSEGAAPRGDAEGRVHAARRAAGRGDRRRRDWPLLEPVREQAPAGRGLHGLRRARLREGSAQLHRPAGGRREPNHYRDSHCRNRRRGEAEVPPLLAADPARQRRDSAELAEGDPAAARRPTPCRRRRGACSGPSSRARRRSWRRRRSRTRRSRSPARSTPRGRASGC